MEGVERVAFGARPPKPLSTLELEKDSRDSDCSCHVNWDFSCTDSIKS